MTSTTDVDEIRRRIFEAEGGVEFTLVFPETERKFTYRFRRGEDKLGFTADFREGAEYTPLARVFQRYREIPGWANTRIQSRRVNVYEAPYRYLNQFLSVMTAALINKVRHLNSEKIQIEFDKDRVEAFTAQQETGD